MTEESASSSRLVLGIDGGGSKTASAVALLETSTNDQAVIKVIGRGSSGPSNLQLGIVEAFANLDLAIDAAFADAKIERRMAQGICFGLAGADREEEKQALQDWAFKNAIADQVKIVNDAVPILFAEDDKGEGIALICGTGSFAFARNFKGQTARCGGWGPTIGDEGSGYWLGTEGIRHAVRFVDGRGDKTVLLEKILDHFGLTNSSQLIEKLYRPAISRRELAQLSKVVHDSATNGDEVASRIIDEAARNLAELVTSVATKVSMPDSFTLAFAGGVLLNQSMLYSNVVGKIRDSFGDQVSIQDVHDPIVGALRLAAQP